MNKKISRKINLQLFAEETSSTEGQSGQQENNSQEPSNVSEKKYSDDDLDKILNAKFARWQEKHQKEIDEAQKLAEMNAQQRAEHERDQLRKQLNALTEKNAISEMQSTARKMLSQENINISDELLSMLVTSDAAKTKATVDAFAKLFNDSVKKTVADILKGEPPKAGEGKKLTKSDIMAVKDQNERQRLIAENIELFK